MKFLGVATLAVLATSAAAHQRKRCLTDAATQRIIDNSIIFLQHFDVAAANATAYATFAPEIMEIGDSINALRGDPLGTVVAGNATKYIADGLSAPPIPKINTVDQFHSCTRFLWYWEFIGIGPERVRGVTIGTVDTSTGLVVKQVVEFNSLTWATNVGFTVTPPGMKRRGARGMLA